MTDTTTQWRGLHNPERHFSAFGTGTPLCEECGDALCVPSNPCYCCLEAEVEVLRAQVARVREAVAYAERNYDAPIVTIGAIKIALDGGDA